MFNNLLVSFAFSKTGLVNINTLRIICDVWEVFVSGTIHDRTQQLATQKWPKYYIRNNLEKSLVVCAAVTYEISYSKEVYE